MSSFILKKDWLNGFNFINNLKFKIFNNINYTILEKIQFSKIVIFGKGSYLDKRLKILELNNIKLEIVYYLDNSDEKVSSCDNTYHPNTINISKYPVVIASSFYKEIRVQLKGMGAEEVYTMEDLFLEDLEKKISIILLNYILYFQMPVVFSKLIVHTFNSYAFINKVDNYKNINLYQEKPLFKIFLTILKTKSKRKYIMPLLIYLEEATPSEIKNFLQRKNIFIILNYNFFALLHNGLIKGVSPVELCSLIKHSSNEKLYSNSEKLKLFFYISLISRVHNLDTSKYISLTELTEVSNLPISEKGLYSSIVINLLEQDKTKQKLHSYIMNRLFKCSDSHTIISKKPKVALCISGQLRGYKEAFDSISKLIIHNKDIEVDTYVHSWINIGARKLSGVNMERLTTANNFNKAFKEITQSFTEKSLQDRYYSLNNLICESKMIDEEEVKLFYNTPHVVLDDENEDKFKQMTNSEKMYYKMYEVNKLVKESKEHYDIVIRIRPDMKIEKMFSVSWNKIAKECNINNTVFGETPYRLDFSLFAMPEAFVIGSQRNMDIYTSTWKTLEYFLKYKMPGARAQAHEAGAFRLWLSNSKIESLKNFALSVSNQKKLSIIEINTLLKDQLKVSTCEYDKLLLKAIEKDLKNG